MITMAGAKTLATIHFSAHCRTNRRVFAIQGSEGRIEVDILSDTAHLSRLRDSKRGRAIGRPNLDAMAGLLAALPDRCSYLFRRMQGKTPHYNLIHAFADHLQGRGPEPTPFEEVDYVVRGCDQIGREIDRQVTARRNT
jgi:predicted dehydrogenase